MKKSKLFSSFPALSGVVLGALILLGILSGCALFGLTDSEPTAPPAQGLVWEQQQDEEADSGEAAELAEEFPHSENPAWRKPAPVKPVPQLQARRLEPPHPPQTPQARHLGQAIEELFAATPLAKTNGQFGVAVLSLQDGEFIYQHNIHQSLAPASNMKLFTTAAALELLSPDYVYETPLEALGPVRDGEVMGDLVIRGSGDPSISWRFHGSDGLQVLRDWARALKEQGIRGIRGDLVGDASLFERFTFTPGWDPNEESIWYAAQTDALSFNENCVKLQVRPGKAMGDPVQVAVQPDVNHLELQNNGRTGSQKAKETLSIVRQSGRNMVTVGGVLPSRQKELIRTLTIDDPALHFVRVLASVLQDSGIKIYGRIRVVRERGILPQGHELHRHLSPPLREIVAVTNTDSNNFLAEQLLLTVGAQVLGYGSRTNGAAAIQAWLADMGVPREEFVMYDGSGLSRLNSVTPNALLTLLRTMYSGPNHEVFRASLARAGEQGTLRRRMRGTPAQGQVQAKTGYIKGVTSLGGYTETLDGKPLAFALIYNGRRPATSYVKSQEDALCVLLRTRTL